MQKLTIFSKLPLYFIKFVLLSALLLFVVFWENFGYFNLLFFLLIFFVLYQESKENFEFSSAKASFLSFFAALIIFGQLFMLESLNYIFVFFIFPFIFFLSSFILTKKDWELKNKIIFISLISAFLLALLKEIYLVESHVILQESLKDYLKQAYFFTLPSNFFLEKIYFFLGYIKHIFFYFSHIENYKIFFRILIFILNFALYIPLFLSSSLLLTFFGKKEEKRELGIYNYLPLLIFLLLYVYIIMSLTAQIDFYRFSDNSTKKITYQNIYEFEK